MADNSYQFTDHGNHQIIVLSPTLNDVPWNKIDGVGTDLSQRLQGLSKPRVIMDISALDYMGSAMVALVVRVWKVVVAQQGQMVVVNRDEEVYHVLDVAGLTSQWVIVGTQSEALTRLGVSQPAKPGAGGGVAGLVLKSLVVLLALVGLAAIVYVVVNGGLPENLRQ